ncbi:DUF1127 domain-containing protein [Bauldia sp.]|uniref:DUF1127 domain-containing protein n=1 Tax=Bauldia sp. TaxID=2575872 RepID=UPI003BAB9232
MTTVDLHRPASAGEKLLRAILLPGARAIAVLRAYRNRRAVANLLSLDPHMLGDMGVTPHDVRSALASRITDDPSTHLASLAQERRAARTAQSRERQRRLSGDSPDQARPTN